MRRSRGVHPPPPFAVTTGRMPVHTTWYSRPDHFPACLSGYGGKRHLRQECRASVRRCSTAPNGRAHHELASQEVHARSSGRSQLACAPSPRTPAPTATATAQALIQLCDKGPARKDVCALAGPGQGLRTSCQIGHISADCRDPIGQPSGT